MPQSQRYPRSVSTWKLSRIRTSNSTFGTSGGKTKYDRTQGLIFVVDCADRDRIDEARQDDEAARNSREARPDAHPRPQLVRAAVVRDLRRRTLRRAHLAHQQPQVMSCGVGGAGAPPRHATPRHAT
ncbi:hypothetical protein MSG28_011198, partial [Choristoneura fumiferana]